MEGEALSIQDQATKDMDDALNGVPKKEPEQTPDESGKSETVTLETETKTEQTEKKTDDTATETEKQTLEIENKEEKKYADIYTNTFDLTHGVQELAKQLKVENKELIDLFVEAQNSKNWSKVESKYKELQGKYTKQLEEQKTVETKKEEKKPEDNSIEKSAASDISDKEFNEVLIDTTKNQVFNDTYLSGKFKKFGAEMPTTQEELDKLEVDFPTLWTQFKDTFSNFYARNKQQATAYMQAEKEAPVHNNSQKEKTKQQIEELAKQWKVEIKNEDIDKFLDEAMKSDHVFENKNGVQFLRENSLYQMFLAQKSPDFYSELEKRHSAEIEKVKTETATAARIKAHEDLTDKEKKGIRSISTADASANISKQVRKIDWNNPDEVKRATEEDAKKELDAFLSS